MTRDHLRHDDKDSTNGTTQVWGVKRLAKARRGAEFDGSTREYGGNGAMGDELEHATAVEDNDDTAH